MPVTANESKRSSVGGRSCKLDCIVTDYCVIATWSHNPNNFVSLHASNLRFSSIDPNKNCESRESTRTQQLAKFEWVPTSGCVHTLSQDGKWRLLAGGNSDVGSLTFSLEVWRTSQYRDTALQEEPMAD